MAFVGRHTVNVVAVCVVSGLNSLSFSSLQSLQSSLNDSKGLGLASLSCFYAALTVSCLLISPVMLQKLGTKKTLILGSVAYGLNAASNFYPKFFILIPSAILCGLGTGPSWAAISTMLNTLAVNKAGLRSSLAEVLTSRYMAFQNASWQISNTVATFVLSQVLTRHVSEEGLLDSSNFSSSCCGARDCGAEIPEETIGTLRPPEVLIRIFLGVFAASGLILAPLIGLFFMDNVKPCYHHVSANLSAEQKQSNWLATLHALREPHLLMLMPFAVFIGAYYSFVVGDFTKSFVSCTQGVHDVGYIIAVFAASDAIFTIIFGLLRQYVSRLVMLTVAATLIEGAFVFSVLWDPEERQRWHLFVLAVVWSVGDAVWQMQIRVFVGALFPTNYGPVFSAVYLFICVGNCLSFAVSILSFVCVSYKIYGLMSLLGVSMLLYYVVEYHTRKGSGELREKSGVSGTDNDRSDGDPLADVETELNSNQAKLE